MVHMKQRQSAGRAVFSFRESFLMAENECSSSMVSVTSFSTVACGTCLFAALNIVSGNLACLFAESLFGVAVVFR